MYVLLSPAAASFLSPPPTKYFLLYYYLLLLVGLLRATTTAATTYLLHPPPPPHPTPPPAQSKEIQVYRYFLLKRGLLKVDMAFGQMRAFKKEQARGCYVAGMVSLNLSNHSKATVRQITFQLKETISLMGRRDVKNETVYGTCTSMAWHAQSKTKAEGGLATLDNKRMLLKFPMPHMLSSSSNLVSVKHEIEVIMDIRRGKDPVIKIPITIIQG